LGCVAQLGLDSGDERCHNGCLVWVL
jgi:hypothetical protein